MCSTYHGVTDYQIWFPFMKGLVGYNILLDDKSLIPNHLPATLKLFFLSTALTYSAFPLAAVHYCDIGV